jgi:hypothetical protein
MAGLCSAGGVDLLDAHAVLHQHATHQSQATDCLVNIVLLEWQVMVLCCCMSCGSIACMWPGLTCMVVVGHGH